MSAARRFLLHPTGKPMGDLGGSYPAPLLEAIRGLLLDTAFDVNTPPGDGFVLVWNNGSGVLTFVDVATVVAAAAPEDGKYFVAEAHAGMSAEIVIPGWAASLDLKPASANAKDDEFSAGSLDGKWSWLNQGTSTIGFSTSSHALITPQASSWRGITQAVPAGNWSARARVECANGLLQTNDAYAGIWVHGSTDGTGDVITIGHDSATANQFRVEQISSYAYSGTRVNAAAAGGTVGYVRVDWNGSQLQAYVAGPGAVAWSKYGSPWTPGSTPAKIGIAARSGDALGAYFDWFRVS